MDWVDIKVSTNESTDMINMNPLDHFNYDMNGPDDQNQDNDNFDLVCERELVDEEQYENQNISAPPNRIEELNTTLQSLGSEICQVLRPSCEKVTALFD